jgi:lipopolysaccharide-induced tumor necrosis factor-alpha factor
MVPVPAAPMFRCPMCADTSMPLEREKISTTGWVLFAVLLIFCLPLCVIGLLQKEKYRVCARCNHQLGRVG